MNKQAFLTELRKGLSELPQGDIEERLSFYSEMIDDRMEEGLSEEDAVSAVGSVNEIAAHILADVPAKEKIRPKRQIKVWEIILLVLGSPIWLSLGIAAAAVIFSLYTVLWSVILSLWAVFGSLVGCGFGGIVAGIGFACDGNVLAGIGMIGAGMVCAGLSVFAFYGCKAAAKGTMMLTRKSAVWIKSCFVRREEA